MPQNRNKLIELFIGNLANSVIHLILEKSISYDEISSKYRKETLNSLNIAKRYREKINPQSIFSEAESQEIKDKIIKRVKSELNLRISKGYSNINLNLMEAETDALLKETKIK